jgi:DHA1 family tetracycline resistance protein-like MFS transporter
MRILFLVVVIDVLGFGILVPLVPYMADRFGAAPTLITAILGSYSLAQLLASPLWGRLSDRFGRRPILMSSLAGAFVSYVLLGFAENLWWLLVSRILAGIMAGNLSAAFAYAADRSVPELRARSMGLVGAAIGTGFALGPAIGGMLAGENELTADFTVPAAVSAALSIVAMLLVYFALPESHPPEARLAQHHERAHPIQLLARRPALRSLTAAAFLVIASQAILESIFAIWSMNRFGFGPRTVGFVMFVLALFAVSMQGGLVRVLAPRFGEVRLAMFGVFTFVAGLVIVAYAGQLAVVVAGFALCGIGAGAFSPTAAALASREATGHDRGAVMGTYQTGGSLARGCVPFVSGAIYSGLGPNAPFLLGACVTLPAAWLVWRSRRLASTIASR